MRHHRSRFRKSLLWVVAAGASACIPTAALACRCKEPSPRQAVKQADGAILGTITTVDRKSDYEVTYAVSVSESWKVKPGAQITVRSGSTCIYRAEAGQRYLLFLRPYTPGSYQTSVCMGNRPEAEAAPTLNILRAVKPAKSAR